ncbi:hypothetical protein [Telmatospirillum siberiense]|uniref:Uncharacterized protein n=1 Tax=Telmatospirillum siberiense TaxID=382514 RepID=A0A2N3PNL8_9PROT|nr:hypothetical protein [Telmatospirillum siberiense]PKU21985.1 hypothetical protein CWS72_24075 [Telmatospirillum siberiense]
MNNQITLPTLALNSFGNRLPRAKTEDESKDADLTGAVLPALFGGQSAEMLGQINQVMGEAVHYAHSYADARDEATPAQDPVSQVDQYTNTWLDPYRGMRPDSFRIG